MVVTWGVEPPPHTIRTCAHDRIRTRVHCFRDRRFTTNQHGHGTVDGQCNRLKSYYGVLSYQSKFPEHPSVAFQCDCGYPVVQVRFLEYGEVVSASFEFLNPFVHIPVKIDKVVVLPPVRMIKNILDCTMSCLNARIDGFEGFVCDDIKSSLIVFVLFAFRCVLFLPFLDFLPNADVNVVEMHIKVVK